MGFSIAELRAIASLETKQFEMGVARVRNSIGSSFAGQLKGVAGMIGAAFSVGALVNFGRQLMVEVAQATRFAKALGVSVSVLEELKDMAEETGASGEGFIQKLAKLTDSQQEALSGNKKLVESFERFGVSLYDLASLSPDELLLKVSQGISKNTKSMKDLNELMGRGAGGEFKSALMSLATNGLPQFDSALDDHMKKLADLETRYQRVIDKIKHFGMAVLAGIGKDDVPGQEKKTWKDYVFGGLVDKSTLYAAGRMAGGIENKPTATAIAGKTKAEIDRDYADAMAPLDAEKEKQSREIIDAERKAFHEDMKKREARDKKVAALRDDIAVLEFRRGQEIRDIRGRPINLSAPAASDSMARMGGYVGGQMNNKAIQLEQQQVDLAKQNIEINKKWLERWVEIQAIQQAIKDVLANGD